MVKIISDTSTLFSTNEGKEQSITITPLHVTIGKKATEN